MRTLRRNYIPGPQCMPGVFAPGILATLRLLQRLHDSGALPPGNVVARPDLLLFCGYASWDGRAINVKAAPWRAEDGSPQIIGCTHDGGRAVDADAVRGKSRRELRALAKGVAWDSEAKALLWTIADDSFGCPVATASASSNDDSAATEEHVRFRQLGRQPGCPAVPPGAVPARAGLVPWG